MGSEFEVECHGFVTGGGEDFGGIEDGGGRVGGYGGERKEEERECEECNGGGGGDGRHCLCENRVCDFLVLVM